MNTLPPGMETAIAAKQKHRRELAVLSYEEKLRILLRLQRISDAIRQTRGEPARAWPLDDKTLLPMSPVPPRISD